MKSLNEDLKTGQFKPVYLLYGEEHYLKKQYRDKLAKALLAEGGDMNYSYYEGKGLRVGEVIDQAETMPFFSDRRVIVIEDSGCFKTASPELADYIKSGPDYTHFIFVESEIDKRGKLYKAVKDRGRAVELARQDENTLLRWIAGNVAKEGKEIGQQTARYFLNKVGSDMENIHAELEKLFCYTLDRPAITNADIDAICTTQITNRIFDMVEAVANHKQDKAVDYYRDLLALKEPPMRILFLLARQFKLLLEVKDLVKKGYPPKEISTKTGLHSFVVGKYRTQAEAFSSRQLKAILTDSVQTEEEVKTGRLTDVLGVELFIMKYSRVQ